VAAIVAGLGIAWVDTRPGWDDTGISALAVVAVCALFGALRPHHAWVWALLVGVWIPALNIALHHNYGALMALGIALIGAYIGAGGRRLLLDPGGNA
jgi:hypothetical protein